MEPSIRPLHHAVNLQDVQLVTKLLQEVASITEIDSDSNTPLHLAFLLKHYEIVDLMLSCIEETSSYHDIINKHGLTHLHIACARGKAQLVYSFDYVGANIKAVVSKTSQEYAGYTCLHFACDSRCLETIEFLLKANKVLGYCLIEKDEDYDHVTYLAKFYSRTIIELHHPKFCFGEEKEKLLSKFQNACFNGYVDEVEMFLKKGEDVNATMDKDDKACPLFTPLHFAVEADRNRQKIVELLLSHGADVNLRNGFCMTPLHSALYSDPFRQGKNLWGENPERDDALKVVYEAVQDKESNLMDTFGLTYFHTAVAMNDLEMVKKFIQNGQADCKPILPNYRNFTMYTPLHFAVRYGHEDMAKLLIKQGADVNANEDKNHFDTPLQVAIRFGQCKMIDFLLAHGANSKILTYQNKSVLHLLVERFGMYEDEKPELLRTVNTFISHDVDVNAVDFCKITPLHKACLMTDKASDMIFKLLDEGADINLLNKDDDIAFCNHYCRNEKVKFEVLLKLYYHVKKVKELGLKVHPKNDEFCKIVMKLKEGWRKKAKEWPAIEKICATEELTYKQQNWYQEIERLKVDMLDENISLYDYVRMDTKEAVKFAKNKKIKEIINDKQLKSVYPVYGFLIPVAHRNSLHLLELQQPTQKIKNILANPSALKSTNSELSHTGDFVPSVLHQHKITNLSQSSEQCNHNDQELPIGISLQDAIQLGILKWVKELLAKGASTKFVDIKKNGPLHIAFTLNHEKIVDLLLSHIQENSEYINFPNDQGITQLHIAASRGNTFVVQKLLEAQANPADYVHENSPIYPGYTPLQFACDFKHLETVKVLTKAMKVHGNITDDNEERFIAISHMSKNDSSLSNFLMKLFQDKQQDGHLSEFHKACFKNSTTDVLQLISRGVDVNAPMNRYSKNYPLNIALHFAAESTRDRQKKVELLLQHGADANRKNGFGMTPLHLAAYSNCNIDEKDDLRNRSDIDNTLKILYNAVINKEANHMDAFGLTYFHIAVALNDLLFVKKMLFQGEDVNRTVLPNFRNFGNYSPLHFSARYGHAEMTKLLIERGAKVDDGNNNPRYNTPLQLAIIYGKCDVMHVLLDHGANAKVVQPMTKKTTLHLLVDRCNEITMRTVEGQDEKANLAWLVEKLVKGGANVEDKDLDGFTAFHSACANLYECSDLVRMLLDVGADINIKAERKTALEFANGSWFKKNYADFFMLYEHVQKLKELGLKVDKKNEEYCELLLKNMRKWEEYEDEDWNSEKDYYGNEAMKQNKQDRQDEIKKLKKDMLTDEVSMYDYIKMNEKMAAAYIGLERLQKVDDMVSAQKLYEHFGYLIPIVYRKSKKWIEDQRKPKTTPAGKRPADKIKNVKRSRK